MDEARRLQYLAAMGVSVWRLRDAQAAPGGTHRAAEPTSSSAPDHHAPSAAAEDAPAHRATAAVQGEQTPQQPGPLRVSPPRDAQTNSPVDTATAASNSIAGMDWSDLKSAVADCRACRLCERRTNTVFGVGDPNADLMLIGEGPGHDEDMRGEPFVGRAGQLLNRMLTAMELNRQQVYIANVVKCRPPNNRNPNPDEASACRAFLARQIGLVRPRLLVSLGGVSATNLLDTTESVGRLRGRVHHYQPGDGSGSIPLIVTYHPSYYLRAHSTADKAKGWQDLQLILRLQRDARRD